MESKKPLFTELNAEDTDQQPTEIESLCVNCYKNGTTRLLLTKIPFYKDVVIMSFCCESCGFENNEIQSGGPIAEKGVRFTLKVESQDDLNRQIVKSDYTSIKIVELNFEIPPKSQKGEITTVEGIINRCINGLEQDQPARRKEHPDLAKQIDEVINKLKDLKEVKNPFTLELEDISGNCFIENKNAPKADPSCTAHYFKRTKEQNDELGIFEENECKDGILHSIQEGEFTLENMETEVVTFNTNCPDCNTPCQTNMKMTKIPHFKEVLIMATVCDACGHRSNEVKSAGGIEPTGIRIEVDVNCRDDFSRDVLKSEMCHLKIPQLELEVGPRALGGRFTTVEGLLVATKEQLTNPSQCYMFGDSVDANSKSRLEQFIKKIDEILEGKLKVTIILDDPTGNSYVQSMDDEKPDDALRIEHYERSFEQNEELGLNDMVTENYES